MKEVKVQGFSDLIMNTKNTRKSPLGDEETTKDETKRIEVERKIKGKDKVKEVNCLDHS